MVDFMHNLTEKSIPMHLITFGQPHVGNNIFCDSLNNKVTGIKIRFVNTLDPIPYILDASYPVFKYLSTIYDSNSSINQLAKYKYCHFTSESFHLDGVYLTTIELFENFKTFSSNIIENIIKRHSGTSYILNLENCFLNQKFVDQFNKDLAILANNI